MSGSLIKENIMTSKLSPLYVSIVLGFGIISCAPDNSQELSPGPRLSAPVLVAEDGRSLSLKNMDTTPAQTWSLSDLLVFSKPEPFDRLEVKSECQAQEQTHSGRVELRLSKELRLFQILPPSLLTLDLEKGPADCLIEFRALTPQGQSHRFLIPRIQVSSPTRSTISIRDIDQMDSIEPRQSFPFAEGKRLQVQSAPAPGTHALLLCDGVRFEFTGDASRLRSLADFDFQPLENEELKKKFINQPFRSCRVAYEKERVITHISSIFTLQLGDWPILVTYLPGPYNNHLKTAEPLSDAIHQTQGYAMIRLSLVNRSKVTQWIRVSNFLPGNSKYITSKYVSTSCHDTYSDGLSLVPSHSLAVLDQKPSYLILKVPPGAHSISYNLKLSFRLGSVRDKLPYLQTKLEKPLLEIQLLETLNDPESTPSFRVNGVQSIDLPDEVLASQPKDHLSATQLFRHCSN